MFMDESLVDQLHPFAYPYFERDKEGALRHGLDRVSGESQRMIMTHAITKYGPLRTHDIDRFPTPTPEGPPKPAQGK